VAKAGFIGTWKEQNAFADLLGLHLWKFPVLESLVLDFSFTRDEELSGFSMKQRVYLSLPPL
jgi:hypothetical protein